MKKENIENDKQQVAKDTEVVEQIIVSLFAIFFWPAVLTYLSSSQLSTRHWAWRVKEKSKEILLATLITTPICAISLYLGLKTLISHNYLLASIYVLIGWLLTTPLALALLSFEFSRIASEISEFKFSIKYLASTKHAILENAFNLAHRRFREYNFLLPLFGNGGSAVLALDAQPKDFRWRRLRKNIPDRNLLNSIVDGDLVIFDQDANSPKSQLVIGGTGSGKTRLLSRMGLAALAEDWRVVVIDFKGGDEEKKEFSTLPDFLNGKNLKVVNFPGTPFDMFKGSRIDIADRLISCLPAPTGGDGDYHRQRAIRAINAVVVRTGADCPRDVEEVIGRIRNGEAYATDELDREMFKQKEKGIPVGQILAESIAARFEPLRRKGEWATSNGFSWSDDWDLAVFSFDATREQEVRLGDLVLMDFDMWLKSNRRNDQPKPILLICDEAGVLEKLPLGSVNLLNIVARGRSSRVGVVIASQTLASLGSNYVGLNEQIASKWIGRTTNPEELINTIGTKEVVEAAYEWGSSGWDTPKSGRQQRAYIVDPDEIRRLRTFYWNVSEAGRTRYIYAPPLRPKE